MSKHLVRIISVTALGFAVQSAWAAPPPPATSLNSCQNAVKTATKAFITNKVAAIGTCLQAVSTQIVKNNAADAHAAAATCVAQFRKLNDSRGVTKQLSHTLAVAIIKKCAPGQTGVTHTLADIIGTGAGVPQPLNAESLNAWCSHSGGDGSIGSLQEWIDCLAAAAECAVDSTIASQYPRALEWLNLVKPSMQALAPPLADPTKITDAVAGLDAVKAEIDGPDNDNLVSIHCGGPGETARFTDNGNGTVTDNLTNLVWEKKTTAVGSGDNFADPHDVDNLYAWSEFSGSGIPPDGSAFTSFLAGLNGGATGVGNTDGSTPGGGFAGYSDWRLPTIAELQTIVDPSVPGCGVGSPCINPVFGPTQSAFYLSAITFDYVPDGVYGVWLVTFGDASFGGVNPDAKTTPNCVRAVRRGL